MASIKASLKAINDAIRQQKWDEALTQAENVIDRDPKNYQAHVFKAFALDKKNQPDLAEAAYKRATDIRSDAQAWQGLIKLYEKQGSRTLQNYQHAALKLAELFRDANEMYKCQDVVDKFIDFARAHGDRAQYVQALNLILPDCPIYPALEGRVPPPARTYETIAQILEVDEKKRINTLIGERRTRLGARIAEVTLEVNREVLCQSKLGEVYEQLTLWVHDDDIRRQYEEKLLQFKYDRLLVTPAADKAAEFAVVQKLANDMVIIKHPFKLAWDIAIEWQDCKEIKDWDVNVLNEYCSHFPDSDLYRVLTGFMTSDFSPFPKKPSETPAPTQATGDSDDNDESEDDEDGGAPTSVIPYTDEDRLLMMTEGISTTNSLLAHRLMGEYYQHLEEHESNVELMRKAMKIMATETEKTGKVFTNTNQVFMLYLGTALVFYQSPRNHGEAKSYFDKVLEVDPTSTAAMIGVGLIYEEEEEFDSAIDFLGRALESDGGNLRVRSEVGWLYALKGDYTRGKAELESLLPSMTGQSVSKDLLAQTQYRLGCCIWNIDSSKSARKSRDGAYAYFLDALMSNFSYAPAYSSLGIYYADYAKDKKRARKCFLKAVELSSSEVESAERLARSFADDGDWDRVELVAQRVVDSGKVRPPPGSKKKGISWPLSALGVAELNKQGYAKAIVSFQQALRIAPEDYHSWVGLGESYHNAGRYIAATKAIQNAQRLEEASEASKFGDTWFTKYMLANVKRELGEFDDAVSLYREVISSRPEEEGVAIALMQTMVENAMNCVEKGLFGNSVDLANDTLSFALTVPSDMTNTFNFWKTIGDACSIFSSVQSRLHDLPVDNIRQLIEVGADHDSAYAILKDVDGVDKAIFTKDVSLEDEKLEVDLERSLHAAILAHKRAVHVSAQDVHAQAVAYYNLGWAQNRAHLCLPSTLRVQASKYQKAAVRCFKRAIELEAGNPDFWNSLGVVTSEINPSVAQHAFVRSLFLNERSAHAWTNLGTLALLQNDLQLANEAFTQAQSNDPDYAHAWLGQGFVALLYGDSKEARGLFTHAMDISESSSILTRRQYPTSLFDHLLTGPPSANIASLVQPLFALTQLKRLKPQDLAYQHLSTLYQERTGDSPRAINTLEKACGHLEASYEATESAESLAQFALAKTDLARSYLAIGEYANAIECGEMALELSSDESAKELTAEQRRKARLSAHLTIGLAEYFAKRPDAAVKYFETALEESSGNPDAACVLAQVLWATGTEEAHERARIVLFDIIESDPSHVQSVLLLGAIALLDADEESLEAVVSELHTLRTSDKVTDAEHSQIGEVLRAVAALSESSREEDVLNQIQNDVMLYPQLPYGWSRLAELSGDEYAADVALNVASKAIPPRGELGAIDLADAYGGTGKVADAQTAIFIAPWTSSGWESLDIAVAT